MLKRIFSLFITSILILGLVPNNVTAQKSDRDIVVYVGGANKVLSSDVRVKESLGSESGIYVVPGTELDKVKEKKQKGEIEAWGYNEKYEVSVVPDDPGYDSQWALPKINASGAWDIATGSNEVVIAVIDTGFQLTHPDLSGKFISGYDFVDDDADPSLPDGGGERYYHGTLVAGAAAASTNNATGVAGMDWGAKIMPIRVMDNDGSGYTYDIAAGIDFARNNGADVINLSLGYHPGIDEDPDPVLEAAVNNAISAGVTVVAASGNENREVSYPAAFDGVIAVGATNQSDERCDESDWGAGTGSNYGPELDVVAPGNSIYTTSVNWNGSSYVSGYGSAGGTSLASPIAAGLATLLLSRYEYTPTQIESILRDSADKLAGMNSQNFTNYYGYGRINAKNSLNNFSKDRLVTSALSFSLGSTKIVGQKMSANFSVTNNNTSPVTLERLKIDIRGNGDAQDFNGANNINLDPGGVIRFSDFNNQRYLTDNASYVAKIKARIAGRWYTLGSARYLTIRNPKTSDFSLALSLDLSPRTQYLGRYVRGSYGVLNKTSSTIFFSRAKINVRSTRHNQDFSGYYNRPSASGNVLIVDQYRKMYYRDTYKCTAIINIFGRWLVLSPAFYLKVK